MKFVEIICDVDRKKASDDAGSTGAYWSYVFAILSMMSEKVDNHARLISTLVLGFFPCRQQKGQLARGRTENRPQLSKSCFSSCQRNTSLNQNKYKELAYDKFGR